MFYTFNYYQIDFINIRIYILYKIEVTTHKHNLQYSYCLKNSR